MNDATIMAIGVTLTHAGTIAGSGQNISDIVNLTMDPSGKNAIDAVLSTAQTTLGVLELISKGMPNVIGLSVSAALIARDINNLGGLKKQVQRLG